MFWSISTTLPSITVTLSFQRYIPISNPLYPKIHGHRTDHSDENKYPFPTNPNVVPASDGSGTILEIGSRVTQFQRGDKVVTLFNQSHQANPITVADTMTGLGGAVDGTLRRYGVFEEKGLIKMPQTLSFKEASTLSCAALTAWNGLFGLESKALKPGDWVLTQGTGGVSIFALQVGLSSLLFSCSPFIQISPDYKLTKAKQKFAKAAGARVISTTSSPQKALTLTSLGADHVLNYKTDPSWGSTAKSLTPGGLGVDHILEVGGPKTMAQSLKAIKPEGTISIIGFLGGVGKEAQPSFLECLSNICIVRGMLVGSKQQFEQMNRAIDAAGIKPVIDERIFALEELKEAYTYMWEQKHFGKVVVRVDADSDDDAGGAKL